MLRKLYEELPEYEPDMYLKGYKPEEISNSLHKSMIKNLKEDDNDETEIVIITKEK